MPRRDDAGHAAGEYDFTLQVGYLLRRAYQRHLAVFQAEAGDNQLTSVQFSTLCALRDNGPLSQSELVRATGIDQATIRGIVDRLRSRGLVTLTRNRDDARKVVITLAARGRDVLDDMIPRAERITELTLENLNPAERLALLYTLRRLAALDAP